MNAEEVDCAKKGDKLGKWKLICKIGEGSYANVFIASDGRDNFSAIKALRMGNVAPTKTKERLVREAWALSLLQKKQNIVRLLEDHTANQLQYIVLELLDGETLFCFVNQENRLEISLALSIAVEVLMGLIPVHKLGITHRDIKPENILLLTDQTVKIIDFNIITVEEGKRPVGYKSLKSAGKAIGPPNFMSPEQAMGQVTDTRSDLYSVGALLYYMIVGKSPYNCEDPMDTMIQHVGAPLPRLPLPVRNMTLERIIQRAMAKKPKDRYQLASHMASALRALQQMLRTKKA